MPTCSFGATGELPGWSVAALQELNISMSDLNDPRVFFAAERTLLAWTRTSLTLMAFGFVIERFGLFVQMLRIIEGHVLRREASFWVGVSFILFGSLLAIVSVVQYRLVLRTLKPVEIPEGYWVNVGVYSNLALAVFGAAITVYFFFGLQ
jgi:putative membrane protein